MVLLLHVLKGKFTIGEITIWFERSNKEMAGEVWLFNNYQRIQMNEYEKCIIYKKHGNDYAILYLYTGNNDKLVKSAKNMLNSNFEMENIWCDNMILGIKIIRTTYGLILS